MQIHQASDEDITLIAFLFDQYREFYKQPSDLEGAVRFLKERLVLNQSVIFYARDDQGVSLGFTQLFPTFSCLSMKRSWILNDIYVTPSARGRHVGRALLERAEKFARSTEARSLTLKTAVDNVPAQALYNSLGWIRNEKFFSYDLDLG